MEARLVITVDYGFGIAAAFRESFVAAPGGGEEGGEAGGLAGGGYLGMLVMKERNWVAAGTNSAVDVSLAYAGDGGAVGGFV